MAAIEFIEKMDRNALKISEESYETYMEAAIEEFNHRPIETESRDSIEISFNEKLDIAEAKAEELFIKAKEAFKVTGERANQAFSSFKESNLAKKSMEKINNFFKDFSKNEFENKETDEQKKQEEFEVQLARAVSLSLLDEPLDLGSSEESSKSDSLIDNDEATVDDKEYADDCSDDIDNLAAGVSKNKEDTHGDNNTK